MAENVQTKVCRLCAETIKVEAKVCPYCCGSQKRFFYISQYNLQAISAVFFFLASLFLVFWIFGTSRQYSPNLHEITVLSTQLGVEANSDRTNVVVSGVLTNASNYSWKLTGFQIRFFDAAGKTIEVGNAGSEYMNLNVLPHSDLSFHLSLYSFIKIPIHASCKMTVTEAREPGFWFNN